MLAIFLYFALADLKTPEPISPADNAEIRKLPREAVLEWSPVDKAESYVLEIDPICGDTWCSESGGRTEIHRDFHKTRYVFESQWDRRARWRVWALAGFLESPKSPWRQFTFATSGLPTPPAAPVQVSPNDNDVVGAPLRLEWTPVTGAETYAVEIDYWDIPTCALSAWCADVGESKVVDNITDTRYTAKFEGKLQARWRVWAVAGDRKSLKSPWRMFRSYGGATGSQDSGGVFKVGGGVTPPQIIYKVDPSFTEEARAAKIHNAEVLISVVVSSDGSAKDPKVVKPYGYGLDEAALECVKKWRFKPGMKDGKPVPVYAQIEVTFRSM